MKNKLIIQVLLAFILISGSASKFVNEAETNYVPNGETAIKIAEAVLVPIYGKAILQKRPFTAKLINNTFWRVEGTLNSDELGGVPIIEIQKKDCKILNVTHTK